MRGWPKALPDAEYKARWLARVFANTERNENGCWLWKGALTESGYACSSYRNKTGRVHRYAYIAINGPLTSDVDVCHTCDTRRCINPEHLWAGSRKENLVDCLEKKRHYYNTLTVCKNGHEFTPENTRWLKSGGGTGIGRACKACSRIRQRIKAGWSPDEARSIPPVPQNAPTPRRRFGRNNRPRLGLGESDGI